MSLHTHHSSSPSSSGPAGWRRIFLAAITLLLCGSVTLHASNIVEVSVVSDRIILLRFDDGHIDYGQTNGTNIVYNDLLDTANVQTLASWGISSIDDAAFSTAINPVAVGRKSKAGDVSTLFTSVDKRFVLDHWVYLKLPVALTEGKTYTVDLGGFAANRETIDFTFDPTELYSESIHVNQLGFVPNSPKYAYVSQWMGNLNHGDVIDGQGRFEDYDGAEFQLVDVNTGQSVFTGTVRMRKRVTDGSPATPNRFDGTPVRIHLGRGVPPQRLPQNYTFSDVLEADFSSFTTPGDYKVVVERMGCSFPFEIAADAFRTPFSYVMKGIFHQRQGIVLELPDGKTRPRDYHPDDIPLERFRYDRTRWLDAPGDRVATDPGDFNNEFLPVYGWYHDAGDWDTNPNHARVPFSLMLLYTLKPENFGDGDIGNRYKLSESDSEWIDEGTDGLPDILNEARWLIDYYRRAKDVGLARGITTGGVPGGYSGVDAGAIDGYPSWGDQRDLRIMAEDPNQTFTYAAAAAWYATSLELAGGDAAEITDWINEAEDAYTWAVNNASASDYNLWNEATRKSRILADAALYRATENVTYQTSFRNSLLASSEFIDGAEGWGAPEYWEYASVIYAMLPTGFPGLDVAFQNQVKAKILLVADNSYVNTSETRGYRVAFNRFKIHILGMQSTPMMTLLLAASEISNDTKYIDAIHTSSAFFLGGNQEHITWINGVGEKSVKFPFHPNSWYLNDVNSKVYSNEIVEGYVPYGSYQSPDWGGFGFAWEGDEDFSKTTMFPRYRYQNWPVMEQRVENRTSIPGSEYTIWQNNASAAMVYGFISNPSTGSYTFNERPTVAIVAPDRISTATGAVLTATTSPDTRRVGYWLEENFIGYSYDRANNFAFDWKPLLPGGTSDLLLTAVAWDDEGKISLPSGPGEKLIDLVSANEVTALEIVPDDFQFATVGDTRQLTVNFTPAAPSNQQVSWSSSDPDIVSVNASGLATAARLGITTITATSLDNGTSDQITVIVGDFTVLQSFTVTPSSATLSVFDTINLVASFTPADATNTELNYVSSNPSAVRVDPSGQVVAISPGQATITASVLGSSLTQTASIIVEDITCNSGLLNRNFSDGIDQWNMTTGSFSAVMDGGNAVIQVGSSSGGDQRISGAVATGTTVTVSARARIGATGDFALLGIDFKDANDETISQRNVRVTNTGYQTLFYSAEAPAGTETLNIWFFSGEEANLFIDEFCVEVPDREVVFTPGDFGFRVNFSPSDIAPPPGYLRDIGELYGNRGSTQQYGWNVDRTADARWRSGSPGLGILEETFIVTRNAASTWEFELPNGFYEVSVIAGDWLDDNTVNSFLIEGTEVQDPDGGDFTVDTLETITVEVTDGRLTIQPGPTASNAFLNVVDIVSVLPGGPPPTDFSLNVNFSPTNVDPPAGFVRDAGDLFGSRGDGFEYGWNIDRTADARNRSSATLGILERTFIVTRTNASVWEVAVPNGNYTVDIVAGDFLASNTINSFIVEGTDVLDPDGGMTKVDTLETVIVEVTDGRLTIQPGPTASNAFLNVVSIAPVTAPPPPPTDFSLDVNFSPTNVAPPAGYVRDAGDPFGNRGNGFEYGWNIDRTADARNRSSATLGILERTFIVTRTNASVWEVAVPNGNYSVDIVAGDFLAANTINSFIVEDTDVLDPDGGRTKVDTLETVIVEVTDGRLTIQPGPTASNAFLNVVSIAAVGTNVSDNPPVAAFDRCNFTGGISYARYSGIGGSDVSALLNSASYPDVPDYTEELTRFEAPRNVNNRYGARIRGYICAPETGSYQFWIASDDRGELNLSTDTLPANKVRIAYNDDNTGYRRWDKFASQRSVSIDLVEGEQYYVEALLKENSGGDHLSIGWRKPSDGAGNDPAEVIPGTALVPFELPFVDAPTDPAICTETGGATYARFDGINGRNVTDLTSDAAYPEDPTFSEIVPSLETPTNVGNFYGASLRALLCAPQTGYYYFWVAGDDRAELSISTDDSPDNATRIAYTTRNTNLRQWNRNYQQRSVAIPLIAGQTYYVEALLKERSGRDHLSVGWRTPADGPGAAPTEVVPGSVLIPYATPRRSFEQTDDADGLVSLEAEEFSENVPGLGRFALLPWTEMADPDASNGLYMVTPEFDVDTFDLGRSQSARLDYDVNFTQTGTHYIWARYRAPNGADNSITTVFDGGIIEQVFAFANSQPNWTWVRLSGTFNVTAPGTKTFAVYMREDGTPIDKFILTTNDAFDPNVTSVQSPVVNPAELVVPSVSVTPEATVTLYPNPSPRGEVTLRVSEDIDGQVTIYDAEGRLVRALPIQGTSAQFRLLRRGVYQVRVVDGDRVFETKQIVIQ